MAKQASHRDQVIAAMQKVGGVVPINDLVQVLPLKKRQVYRVLHGLASSGVVVRNGDDYYLTEDGEKGEVVMDDNKENKIHEEPSPQRTEEEGSLDQTRLFSEHLRNIGIRRDVINTISQMFFSGDINDLHWLKKVLTQQAAGFVSPHQANITLSWWSNTRSLDIDDSLFVKLGKDTLKEEEKPSVPAAPAEIPTPQGLDLGVGWDIQKDESGEWVAIQGGPMTQKEAYDRAERRQAISVVRHQRPSSSSSPTSGTGDPEAKSESQNLTDKVIDRLLDVVFTGGGIGGNSNSNETALLERLRASEEKIQTMMQAQQEERMQRMEAMILQSVNRDPLEEWRRVENYKHSLGAGAPIITDQSPAVQLIKDATEKFDRTSGRLFGIMERVMLKSDFNPEETRSPEEREARAAELLNVVNQGEEVRSLRQATFGI